MKILDRDDLQTPEDLRVTADFVRHAGKLYKKGQLITGVTGNDKAVLVATKKCVIENSSDEDTEGEEKDKGKGKGK